MHHAFFAMNDFRGARGLSGYVSPFDGRARTAPAEKRHRKKPFLLLFVVPDDLKLL